MDLTEKDIKKVAKLCRIGINEDEAMMYVKELSEILKMIEQLQSVNTENIPQMTSVIKASLPTREDIISEECNVDDILANAPLQQLNCFVVPKVVE